MYKINEKTKNVVVESEDAWKLRVIRLQRDQAVNPSNYCKEEDSAYRRITQLRNKERTSITLYGDHTLESGEGYYFAIVMDYSNELGEVAP